MTNWADPKTLWLNITNVVLALVCLTCWALVLGAVVKQVMARAKNRSRDLALDPHTLAIPELGTTMADGGEPVDPKDEK